MNSRRGRRKRKAITGIIAALLLIALFGLALYAIEKLGERDSQFGDSGDFASDGEEFFLTFGDDDYECSDLYSAYVFAGIDGGGDDLGEGFNGELADFILVLLTDKTTEKYAYYQIDRNTMTDIAIPDEDGTYSGATYTEQICTSHWYGADEDERNANLVRAVSGLLGGLEIEGYYVLGMEDLDKLNHALGGVTVTIETDMTSVDPAFTEGATIKLTDEQTESYLRARYALEDDSNKARMSRHRQYMLSAFETVKEKIHEDPGYVNDLYAELKNCIQTDSSSRDLSVIANQLNNFEGQGILTFDGEVKINDTLGDGVDHEEFYADQDSIVEELSKTMELRYSGE